MMVLFTLVLTVIMGLASIVIDVGVLRNKNQTLWNSLDAGALAGVTQLPGDATAANSRPTTSRRTTQTSRPPTSASASDASSGIGTRTESGRRRHRSRLHPGCRSRVALRGRLRRTMRPGCSQRDLQHDRRDGRRHGAVRLRQCRRRAQRHHEHGRFGRLQGSVWRAPDDAGRRRDDHRPNREHERV